MTLIDGDINDPLYQVRLAIGDTDCPPDYFSDAFIEDALSKYSSDVRTTSIELLKILLAKVSDCIDEEVGEVKAEWGKLYERKKDLLDSIINDPSYISGMLGIQFGGTSKAKVQTNRDNTDWNGPSIYRGFYTEDED